jgi:hypothetical protein
MTDPRKARLARNEAAFRSLNEQLVTGPHTMPRGEQDLAGFVCECGDAGCTAVVRVSLAKYEEVRSDPRRFLLVPGHESPDTEDVVEQGDGYAIAEKHPDVGDIVEGSDPRR